MKKRLVHLLANALADMRRAKAHGDRAMVRVCAAEIAAFSDSFSFVHVTNMQYINNVFMRIDILEDDHERYVEVHPCLEETCGFQLLGNANPDTCAKLQAILTCKV